MRKTIATIITLGLVLGLSGTAHAARVEANANAKPKVSKRHHRVDWDADLSISNNTRYTLRLRCTVWLETKKHRYGNYVSTWWSGPDKTLRYHVGPHSSQTHDFSLSEAFSRLKRWEYTTDPPSDADGDGYDDGRYVRKGWDYKYDYDGSCSGRFHARPVGEPLRVRFAA
jgi:hypothetical protein